MSLIYFDINNEYGTSAVWHIEEDRSFFIEKLGIDPPLEVSKTKRRELEWLGSRYLALLIDQLSPDEIVKDQYGKPHSESLHISISHSGAYVAYASHHKVDIGIDLQTINEKIEKISSKYTSNEEIQRLNFGCTGFDALHLIWTIKESVFKLYGRKNLPFKEGIVLEKSQCDLNKIITTGKIVKAGEILPFKSKSIDQNGYFFTQAVLETSKE